MGVAAGLHHDLTCVLLHSRDEVVARGVTGASMPSVDENGVLMARDEESGGTWMGFHTQTGAFAALSNVRHKAPRLKHELHSRGELVSRVLHGDTAAVESGAFSAFNIIYGTVQPDGPSQLKYGASIPDATGKWHTSVFDFSGAFRTNGRVKAQAPLCLHAGSKDEGICYFKSNESNGVMGEGEWPKTGWLRAQTQMALSMPDVANASGEAAAHALMSQMDAALLCTEISEPMVRLQNDKVARQMATEMSPFTLQQEKCLMKGPHVSLMSLERQPYSTVSQTALIISSSEACAFFAHRKATDAFAAAAALGRAAGDCADCAPMMGPWVWQRVPLPPLDHQT
eukprot:scaffold41314_cov36-Tisochrysis_lutea.AAC.1